MKNRLLLFFIAFGTYATACIAANGVPAIICKPVLLQLQPDGRVMLRSSDVEYDVLNPGCGALSTLPDSVMYDCRDAGSVRIFNLTVKDSCGNLGLCAVEVTIAGYDRCTPEIRSVSPCACKNNATTLNDGQFAEHIRIHSTSNNTWTVAQASGLYFAGSAQPPQQADLIHTGVTFEEMPPGSGDFFLSGIHIDGEGYNMLVVSDKYDTLTIADTCWYPETGIASDLSGPFCAHSNPITLQGDPGDDHFAFAAFSVNSFPGTTFDPAVLGAGVHLVRYTVDGGAAGENSDDDPGCIQSVEMAVQVLTTPSAVVCNDLVLVSLDASCSAAITPDLILEGSYGCFDDYRVLLTDQSGQPLFNPLTGNVIGDTITATVEHLLSGNTCWGRLIVEDKSAPVLLCNPLTAPCIVSDLSPNFLANGLGLKDAQVLLSDNCSGATLSYTDAMVDLKCDEPGLSARLLRTWSAEDGQGNQSTCVQQIELQRPGPAQIVLPGDTSVYCESPLTAPAFTGVPYLNYNQIAFPLLPGAGACEWHVAYADQVLPECDGEYKILRTWALLNACDTLLPGVNPLVHIQVIRVLDTIGPQFVCPADVTVSTAPTTCSAELDLPDVFVADNCSRPASIAATYAVNGITQTIFGSFSDFPGNQYNNSDTLGVLGTVALSTPGNTIVQYTATDDCGKSSSCTFIVSVVDQIPPVVACDPFTQVSLGIDGTVFIDASTFDNGSYDNCNGVIFKVRRLTVNSCQPNNRFFDRVKFCCEDLGDTVSVLLRVYDAVLPVGDVSLTFLEENSNDCMVHVLVDDKIKPVCLPPADVVASCEQFDPTLWSYGFADGIDNCCMDSVAVTSNFTRFDTLCNKGTISRVFRAVDCAGLSNQCTQQVIVQLDQSYFIRFPDDVYFGTCDSLGDAPKPVFFGENCELLGVSFEDEVYSVVPDACYKIERTWKIINWCTYDPNAPCISVPNPEPAFGLTNPVNLPGPIVSPAGSPAPWSPTVVKIRPGDASTTNFSVFWDNTANCYSYKQVIKIVDQKAPKLGECTDTLPVNDWSENSAQFWNEPKLFDPVTGSHNLCEAEVDLSINANDDCSGADVSFRYLLFLDLDQDGSLETVVSSTNPPGFNNVQKGNAMNPNFTGGIPQAFDQRAVPANQKYGFALSVVQNGPNRTAKVAWNTAQSPATFANPQLPYGKHKIKWFVSDNCGNETVCEYPVAVRDGKKPTVTCVNGLSVNLMPGGLVSLDALDFLLYGEDNCTPANRLQYGIRKAGAGNGFPVDNMGNPVEQVAFDCFQTGLQVIELWAKDLAGNADFCSAAVTVVDNFGICDSITTIVAGVLLTDTGAGISGVDVQLQAQGFGGQSTTYADASDTDGKFLFSKTLQPAGLYTITPSKNENPLNGVSTYDLVLISKHILGAQPLGSPYRMIAADVNRSGSITTFDIVELRKLILGLYTQFPVNTSWRFIDESFVFLNPANPWVTPFPESISKTASSQFDDDHRFVGVKIGDVNGSAIAAIQSDPAAETRSGRTVFMDATDRWVEAGDAFALAFHMETPVWGYQFTLEFDGLLLEELSPGDALTLEHFAVHPNAITASVENEEGRDFVLHFRARQAGRISDMIRVSNRIARTEAYGALGELLNVSLRFDGADDSLFAVFPNQPNPFLEKTTIGFQLPEAAEVTLSILDESGKTVHRRKGGFSKGYNAVEVNRTQLPAPGVYYFRVNTEKYSGTGMMILGR